MNAFGLNLNLKVNYWFKYKVVKLKIKLNSAWSGRDGNFSHLQTSMYEFFNWPKFFSV